MRLSWLGRGGAIFLLANLVPVWAMFAPGLAVAGQGNRGVKRCRQIVLNGEVGEKQEWRAAIGEGWVFRLVPIVGAPLASAPTGSGPTNGEGYSGWDLVVDRARGGGYPDGLLLATPPYGSLNEREVGTTYGLRAQDAIAWTPRRFHFLTTVEQWARARELYPAVMGGAQKDAQSEAAARELLAMAGGGSGTAGLGSGEFAVLDARLVAGVADPPVYARQWAAHLAMVPHQLEPSASGGVAPERGKLEWIRFRVTLSLPAWWKLASRMPSSETNCAE